MFGIQMYTLRNSMTTPENLENTLKRVSDMGYQSVQITPPGFITVAQLADQLKSHNLKADSAIIPVYTITDQIDVAVKNCALLETNVVRTDSIRNEDRCREEGYHLFAEHLNKCGELLAKNGLLFMYHFHSFEFIKLADGLTGMDILLNETNPEWVMFQPDVFWLIAAGNEPSKALYRFKGRAKYMHCKDYVIIAAKTGELEHTERASAPVGTGNLLWPDIFKTAKEIGIDNFVVEDDMGILDPFDSAKQSIDNMRKFGF